MEAWKGDPLSPYLFVIAMQTSMAKMETLQNNSQFRYHVKADKINLNHIIIFADDILMLCHGNLTSINMLLDCVRDFQTTRVFMQIQKSPRVFSPTFLLE